MGRRGPQRKDGKRKNGRLTLEARMAAFDQEERETLSTGIDARMRHFDMDWTNARDQRAGTVIGRLYMQNSVSRPQYEAAMQYIRDRETYMRLDGLRESPQAVDLNKVHGLPVSSEEELQQATTRAKKRYYDAQRAVQDKQTEIGGSGNLFRALQVFLIKDVHIFTLDGDLRLALNALAKHYGYTGVMAA